MVGVKCSTKDTIKLTDCVPFQGSLKKRTQVDLDLLKDSIKNEGLLMPFAVWKHEGKNFLLDGHGRKEALTQIAMEDADVITQDFPCVFIEADTEDAARKALLQITSQYGKITKTGVKQFTATIPNYVAPSIKKFVAKPVTHSEQHVPIKVPSEATHRVIRVKVPIEKVDQVLEVFKQFNFLEVIG